MASKAEINRCGDRLRELLVLATSSEPAEVTQSHVDAIRTVQAFRAEFQYPTTKTAVGLRQFVARESSEILVAQRLKRLPQIINKLVRMPGSKLARMEDVGGCRAVLPGGRREIDAVLKRIRRNWVVKRERDYIVRPKPTGYRGVHVVIERDGRRVEIQLRTPAQQQWADAVERLAGRLEVPLKDGGGPTELIEYFRLAAEGLAADEEGRELEPGFMAAFDASRHRVSRYFER